MQKFLFKFDFVVVLFFGILFLSGFERFENEFLFSPIEYHFPVNIFIDYNRELIGFLLTLLFIFIFLKIEYFKKTPATYLYPLIVFNCFLSVKMLLQDNTLWYRNILGAIVIYGIFSACSELSKKENLFGVLKKIAIVVISAWVAVVAFMYLRGGDDAISWGDRYFFFSSHMNHAGAVWAFASILLVCILLFDESANRWQVLPLLAISLAFLIMTDSRGSMISWFFGFLVAARYSKIKLSTLAIIVIPVSILLIFENQESILNFFYGQIERGNTRADVYAIALEDFFDNLIIGAPIFEGRAIYVENTVLAFMQVGGLIGLFFCILFYVPVIRLLFTKLRTPTLENDAATMTALLTCAVVASMFEAYPLNFVSAGSLMLLLPLAFFSKK